MSIPKSVILLPIAFLAFAVQLFPIVGVIIAMALAPFWPVLLVNGAAVGVALEVWLRDEDGPSRLWLLLPVIWFGGYLGLFVCDRIALSSLRSEAAATNQGAPLPFDPRLHSLVFERGGNDYLFSDPGVLLRNGHLPVVFERQRLDGGRQVRTIAYRLIPASECQRLSGRRGELQRAGILFGRYGELCMMQAPETPAGAIVELRAQEKEGVEHGMPVRRLTLDLRMPDGTTRRLTSGTAQPLPPIPMPVAGCVLGPCEIGFYRQRGATFGDSEGGAAGLIAQALGLGPPRQHATMPTEQAQARLAHAEAAAMRHDLDNLERLLADPAARIDVVPFTLLRQHPERLAPLAGRIMGGLERAAASDDATGNNGRHLAQLLAVLPRSDFRAIGPRLLALYARHPAEHWLYETQHLFQRAGDLGSSAMPLLLSRLDRGPLRVWEPAVVALCRIGAQAAASAGPRLLTYWRRHGGSERTGEVDLALYAALLRLGLRTEAGEVTQRYRGDWYRAAWREINPATPPERCDPNWRAPQSSSSS